ncbi:MAG: hypothetical protein IPK68_22615 [Bdellovibrionales bacterium]|nr:hypothetical protein [Bdellovibrionales bacterium]
MQESPPDILITNFSMLSVMMVRTTENNLFESTKNWLRESKENVFYLVLDELHSYRGTGGTEISYTIKTFLDRIGLTPDHPQVRIICTSASLEDSDTKDGDPKFLKDFFGLSGVKQTFVTIKGDIDSRKAFPKESLKEITPSLEKFCQKQDEASFESAIAKIKSTIGISSGNSWDILEKSGLHDLLLSLSSQLQASSYPGIEISSYPLSISEISEKLFVGNLAAAEGLLRLLTCDIQYTRGSYSGKSVSMFLSEIWMVSGDQWQ